MSRPDQALFEHDVQSAAFRMGVAKGQWGLVEANTLPPNAAWPNVFFWLSAPARGEAPEKFFIALDVAGYRTKSPTGTFWDPETKATLALARRPKGRENSRVAKVFRTDWENGRAFYHPYDRHAADTHTNWPAEMPHLLWKSTNTIVDFLDMVHALLNCEDYIGV